METPVPTNRFGLPESFRPLLWSFRFAAVDPDKSKEDIIVNTINDGTLAHMRWIINRYGKETIRSVLAKRLSTEFHPESLNLASVIFDFPRESLSAIRRVPPLRYA